MKSFNDYIKEAKLSAKQKKIAAIAGDKDKIDADDLAALRAGKKPVEEGCSDKDMKKEELVGNQYKLDKNKNGKIDSDDLKQLRGEGVLKPELEKGFPARGVKTGASAPKGTMYGYQTKKEKAAAMRVYAKHGVVMHNGSPIRDDDIKEEAEQIDELSKKTLGSYVKKAAHDARMNGQIASDFENRADRVRKQSSKDSNERLHRKYLEKAWKRDAGIAKAVGKLTKEEAELDEGRVNQLSYDLDNMSHDEFHKQYGNPKSHYDPTNFKKPVQKGHEMERAKELAQRGMKSLSNEEVERIEEKLAQMDETISIRKTKPDLVAGGRPSVPSHKQPDLVAGGRPNVKPKVQTEEVEQIEEISKAAADRYLKGRGGRAHDDSLMYDKFDDSRSADDDRKLNNREAGYERAHAIRAGKTWSGKPAYKNKTAATKAADKNFKLEQVEPIEELSRNTLGSYAKKATKDVKSQKADYDYLHSDDDAEHEDDGSETMKGHDARRIRNRETGIDRAVGKLAKEEVSAEMSPYLKATLSVMDEGKIDDLRDAQKLRAATKSAYDKDYKVDTSHPTITVNKGTAYGGAAQKDDEGDEKKSDNETQEKRGRGRPAGKVGKYKARGSKSVDKDIDDREYSLHLPK